MTATTSSYSLLSHAHQKNVVYGVKYRKNCSHERIFPRSRAHIRRPTRSSIGYAVNNLPKCILLTLIFSRVQSSLLQEIIVLGNIKMKYLTSEKMPLTYVTIASATNDGHFFVTFRGTIVS